MLQLLVVLVALIMRDTAYLLPQPYATTLEIRPFTTLLNVRKCIRTSVSIWSSLLLCEYYRNERQTSE
jgi:hypothetical protein